MVVKLFLLCMFINVFEYLLAFWRKRCRIFLNTSLNCMQHVLKWMQEEKKVSSRNNNIISVLHRLVETKSFKEENRYVSGVLRACFTLKACKSLQTSFTLVGTCQTTNVLFMCRTKCVFKKRCMLAQFHFHSSKVKPKTKKSMDAFSTYDKHLT